MDSPSDDLQAARNAGWRRSIARPAGVIKYASNISGSWIIVTVDEHATSVYGPALVHDASGHAHLAYERKANQDSGRLRYATNVSGTWQTFTLSDESIAYEPLYEYPRVVDASGFVHITYREDSDEAPRKYGTNATGEWKTATLDVAGLSLKAGPVLAADDELHIVFPRWDDELRHVALRCWED